MVSQLKIKILQTKLWSDSCLLYQSPLVTFLPHSLPQPPLPILRPHWPSSSSLELSLSTPLWCLVCSFSPHLKKELCLVQVHLSFRIQLKHQRNFPWPHILGQVPCYTPIAPGIFFHKIIHCWNNIFICIIMCLILLSLTASSMNSVTMTALLINVSPEPSIVPGIEMEVK